MPSCEWLPQSGRTHLRSSHYIKKFVALLAATVGWAGATKGTFAFFGGLRRRVQCQGTDGSKSWGCLWLA